MQIIFHQLTEDSNLYPAFVLKMAWELCNKPIKSVIRIYLMEIFATAFTIATEIHMRE